MKPSSAEIPLFRRTTRKFEARPIVGLTIDRTYPCEGLSFFAGRQHGRNVFFRAAENRFDAAVVAIAHPKPESYGYSSVSRSRRDTRPPVRGQ